MKAETVTLGGEARFASCPKRRPRHALATNDDPAMDGRGGRIFDYLFGTYVWASRLKYRRDKFFERATWHADQETYYGRLVADAASSSFRGKTAEPAPESPTETITVPVKTIERWLGLP